MSRYRNINSPLLSFAGFTDTPTNDMIFYQAMQQKCKYIHFNLTQ